MPNYIKSRHNCDQSVTILPKNATKKHQLKPSKCFSFLWLRGQDSNLRPSGYERHLTAFCEFVKIRVFVGISVFTRVLVYGTFVHFYGIFGEDFTQFLPNSCSTFVLRFMALVSAFLKMKKINFWR